MNHALEQIAADLTSLENADLTVADAVWIGTALLHYESKSDGPFSTDAIAYSVSKRHLTKAAPRSIVQHVNQHCVANRPPQPNRACMLFATGGGNRKLFRESSDRRDPAREGGRTHPDWEKLPAQYAFLRDWYETVWDKPSSAPQLDPLLALAGTGRGMFGDQGADAYVNSLREGWGDTR